MIKIYTTENCFYCKKVKKYLKFGGVKFKELDVTDNIPYRTEMIEKSKGFAVPVIDDNGDIFVGFNKPKLDALIEKYGKRSN